MSIKAWLPAPSLPVENRVKPAHPEVKTVATAGPPPYGAREGWAPRIPSDFGDGGAFPEIHFSQYPLNMGLEDRDSNTKVIAMQVDAQGKVKYDALVRQGHGKDRIIYSKPSDLLPKTDGMDLDKPDEEAVKKTTEDTRNALEKLINAKISAALPNKVAIANGQKEPPKYIRYTPSQQGVAYNSGAKQRIIRMVEAQKDPMEPPKFKTNKKIPRGPPSPPAPVLHSPTRKVTVKEQQEWKIPPCISNWKNPRGYTIPLDKRLAADGRGLQDNTINDNFAKFAEALYIADRKAREAVDMRANIEKAMAAKEKEEQEQKLRLIAQKAREERSGIIRGDPEETEAAERDELRRDRHKERERDRRIKRANPGKAEKMRSMEDRDITEKIALGQAAAGQTELYDQRLFNASSGLDSGYGLEDDQYNVYDQPWRKGGGSAANTIYRPKKDLDSDLYGDNVEEYTKNKRFVADKEFAGADHSRSHDGPVQFEKDIVEEDPFGLTQFLTDVKNLKRPRDDDSKSRKRRG
ncbi:hypothetical protein ACHWQZ_G018571 [Mnemiopsis leidyi]